MPLRPIVTEPCSPTVKSARIIPFLPIVSVPFSTLTVSCVRLILSAIDTVAPVIFVFPFPVIPLSSWIEPPVMLTVPSFWIALELFVFVIVTLFRFKIAFSLVMLAIEPWR